MSGGKNREWGYASYDIDDGSLIYTSYEKNGSVNQYHDNGDGGHSHSHWNDKESHDNGDSPSQSRSESNGSPNPSIGEVQESGGCYLTTACMVHFLSNFNDNCEELTILRWFRDTYVSKEDIERYYAVAPAIVSSINNEENSLAIYEYIYDNVVDFCVEAIKNGEYNLAYQRYMNSVILLERQFKSNKRQRTIC